MCYDVASTYFEGLARASDRFSSRAFGYSRDHRGNGNNITLTTRRTPLQTQAPTAVGADTRTWDKAAIT